MFEARLVVVERHHQGEDRLPVLDREHAARREALAVADAIHLVDDRHSRVAADQEIRMHRMRRAALDGAAGRDQRLSDHLAAEHALPAVLGAAPAKEIHLELLEVEHIEHGLDGSGHGANLGGTRVRLSSSERENETGPARGRSDRETSVSSISSRRRVAPSRPRSDRCRRSRHCRSRSRAPLRRRTAR